MTRLVNELLDQARLDSGQTFLEYTTFSPYQLIESIYNRLSVLAEKKGLEFNWVYDHNLPAELYGDVPHLKQIFINLVGNALKFTDKGHVELRVVNVDEHCWGVIVSDSGIGIPKEDVDKIFDVFHQVDPSYTREYGGFGLGLSITKQLVDLMNGTVSVTSEVNKGSEFIVHLPKIVS